MWLKEEGCPFKATPAWDGFMRLAKWREDFLLNNPTANLYAAESGIQTEEQILKKAEVHPNSISGLLG